MPKVHVISLADGLFTAAMKIPDFQAKLEQFARTEVALHRFRKSRYSPQSLRILAKAKQATAGATLREKGRTAEAAAFLQICDTLHPKPKFRN